METIFRVLAIVLALGALVPATASISIAAATPLPRIEYEVQMGSRKATLHIEPTIAIGGEDGVWRARVELLIDATDLRAVIERELMQSFKNNRCGERSYLTDGKVEPGPSGDLLLSTRLRYDHFACPPVLFGKEIGGGLYVLRQSFDITASAVPVITDEFIGAKISVRSVIPDGLLGRTGVDPFLRAGLQWKVDAAMADARLALPNEFQTYNVAVQAIHFVDLGNRRLGIAISAAAELTEAELARLIACNCSG